MAILVAYMPAGADADIPRQLKDQSDRGAAIIGGAFVEHFLKMLLLSRMRKLSNNRERDLFEGFGPLAGFSGKIEIAYALGLLNDKARSDLTIIKQIRDKFAHEVLGVEWSFTHPWVADKCKELELINVFGPPIWPGSGSPSLSAKDPRGRFILTVYLLCGQLHGEAENSAQLYSPSFLTV